MQQSQSSCPTINKCDVNVLMIEQLSPSLIEATKSSKLLTPAVKEYFEGLQQLGDLPNHYLAHELLSQTNKNLYIIHINNNQESRIIISNFNTEPPQSRDTLYERVTSYFRSKPTTNTKCTSQYSATITPRRVEALIITNLPDRLKHTCSSIDAVRANIQEYLSTAPEVLRETQTLTISNTRNRLTSRYITDKHNPRIIMSYYNREEDEAPYSGGSKEKSAQGEENPCQKLFYHYWQVAASYMPPAKDKDV